MIRGGIGLFYENSIWNNNLFDRARPLAARFFLGPDAMFRAEPPRPDRARPTCGQPIGTVGSQIIADQQEYQAATLAAGPCQ